MKRIVALLFGLWLSAGAAIAGSSPNLTFGQVLTPAQWNALFQAKEDELGYTPLNTAGGIMLGPLGTTASTVTQSGFNIPPGTAPGTPVNGDIWTTTAGIFVQINGATVGPLASTTGPPLAAPVTITGSNANALAVGLNGATNPAFNVDTSTASSATGLNVKSAAAGAGIALSAISSGTNESISLNAKGSGAINIGTAGTGNIVLGNSGSSGQFTVQSLAAIFTTPGTQSLIVGANGTTNPTLQIDDSASSVATGIYITGKAAGSGVSIAAISSATNEALTIVAKGNASIGLNSPTTITSSSALALTVGPNGTTNPSFNVDASTASAVTGYNIKSAAAGGGLALSVTSSGTNEPLSINSKGTGILSLQSVATGGVNVGAATGTTNSGDVNISGTFKVNGTAVSGAGTVTTPGGGLVSSTTANCSQSAGAGTLSAARCVNAQSGTSYAIADGDRGKIITFSNASAIAVTLAQAGTASNFFGGWYIEIQNIGTVCTGGVVTITATGSTIMVNGVSVSSFKIYPGQSGDLISDGINYIWRTNGGSNWVCLNSITAASQTSIADTTSFTAAFNEFEITCENIIATTNNSTLELSVHSGGSFPATSYLASAMVAGASVASVTSTTFIPLSSNSAIQNSGNGSSGEIHVRNPSQTSTYKMFYGQFGAANGTNTVVTSFAGYWQGGTGAVDGWEITMGGNTITSGKCEVFGRL